MGYDLDSNWIVQGASRVMPRRSVSPGLAQYNRQWSLIKHLPHIKVIYALIHDWSPDHQASFWTFALASIIHSGPLLARAGCEFNYEHVEKGSFAHAAPFAIAQVLGDIGSWNIINSGEKPVPRCEINVNGVVYSSFGENESRARNLFDLIATAYDKGAFDITIDSLMATNPEVAQIIFAPNLEELMTRHEGKNDFWGMFGSLVKMIGVYLVVQEAAYAAAGLLLYGYITKGILAELEAHRSSKEEIKQIATDLVFPRLEPRLTHLESKVVKTEIVEEVELHSYVDSVPMVSDDEYREVTLACSVGFLNTDAFSRTWAYHHYKLYESQHLVRQKRPDWYMELRSRGDRALLDSGFNHLDAALRARGKRRTKVFYAGSASTSFQFSWVHKNVEVHIPTPAPTVALDFVDSTKVAIKRHDKPSSWLGEFMADPLNSMVIIDAFQFDHRKQLEVINPLVSNSHSFIINLLTKFFPDRVNKSTQHENAPLLMVFRMTMVNDNASYVSWRDFFFRAAKSYFIHYYPSSDIFGPDFTVVLVRRVEYDPRVFYKKPPLDIIQATDLRRIVAQRQFFEAIADHRMSMVSIDIVAHHIRINAHRDFASAKLHFNKMNQVRVIGDELLYYDPQTVKEYYNTIARSVIGDKASKSNRKKTGEKKSPGLSHLATGAETVNRIMAGLNMA